MNKIILILSIALLLPISTFAVEDVNIVNNDIIEFSQENPLEEKSLIEEFGNDEPKTTTEEAVSNKSDLNKEYSPFKEPVSKRKIAKRFIAAMAGVAISSILLFIILTIYNKLRDKFTKSTKNLNGEVSLETPDNFNTAIKTFLEKTNWKG